MAVTTIQPYLPIKEPLVEADNGQLTTVGLTWFQQQAGNIAAMAAFLNTVIGVNTFTVGTQPTLGAGDAGFIGWLTDYKHTLRWTGTAWEFFGDSQNAFFADFVVVPQSGLWQLCDGTATKYLTLGATLTETSFTVPNLIATPAYRKAIAAYTGTINAKAGSTGTGSTGTGTTGTGTTGTGTSPSSPVLAPVTGTITTVQSGTGVTNVWATPLSTPTAINAVIGAASLDIPGLSVPGLSVPALSVPALAVGSIEMANLGCLPYFRR